MYIHPFVAGIMFTILVEVGFSIVAVIALSRNPRKDKENDNEHTDNTY